jgi:glycosyltransferase involved in cell wall biosynthesis
VTESTSEHTERREPSAPRVSVIIPVKDRRDMLLDALDGLDEQSYDDFEVIVVDDGSADGSGEAAAAHVIAGRRVRVISGGGKGAVHARTIGVAASAGAIVAFTDSDCIPAPKWLEAGVAAIDAGADVVNGATRPARALLPLERSMWSGDEGLYPTCNMFYRRDVFDAAGGFDPSVAERWGFRVDRRARGDGFGEDTLLAWRVIRGGGRAVHEPEALVHHAVFPPDAKEYLSRQVRVAAFPAMFKEVPELRRTLLVDRFLLGPRTRMPLYATIAALLTRRRVFIAAALGWWVALRLSELRRFPIPWRRRVALLPIEMGVDVVTTASLLAGSIRHREVVL